MSSATALTPTPEQAYDSPPGPRHAPAPGISFLQLGRVELAKMFNTRSGFWLAASIVILSVLATAGVMVFGSDEAINYGSFSAAVGMPIAIILPIIAVLSVTAEYSQRTGLTTYTLVPSRGRVVAAKAAVTLTVGVVAILVAIGIGALGNLLGAAVRDVTPVWDFAVSDVGLIVLGNAIGMAMGFTLGVLLRNSPAAIVAYFVYSFVFPNIMGALAFYRESFHDVWPWVDLFYNTTSLFEQTPSAEGWAQLGVTMVLWLVLPLAVGLRMLMRAEVK